MPPARHELAELLAFRDALRADPELRDGYARSKQEFVEAAPDGDANLLYTIHKGGFVLQSLYRLGIRKGPAGAPDIDLIVYRGPRGGQLGRMLGIAARELGYRMVALDPDPTARPRGRRPIVVGAYDDVDAARRLAAMADVVTYELEHVGLDAAAPPASWRPAPGLPRRGDARPARRTPVHPRDRGVGRAVARGPWHRRRPRRRRGPGLPVAAQGADRRVRRAQPGPDLGRGRGRGRGDGARRRPRRPAAPGARGRTCAGAGSPRIAARRARAAPSRARRPRRAARGSGATLRPTPIPAP
jgi:hypothetical protein